MIDIDDYCDIKQDQISYSDEKGGRQYVHVTPSNEAIVVPSVTTIMQCVDKSMALTPWAYNVGLEAAFTVMSDKTAFDPEGDPPTFEAVKQVAKERKLTNRDKMEAGGDRGNATHSYLEMRLGGASASKLREHEDPKHYGFFDSVERFLDEYQPELLASEIKVLSLAYMFGGRLDYLVKIGNHPKNRRHENLTGQMAIIDAKTNEAGSVYPNQHLPQVEGYAGALKEMSKGKLDIEKKMVVAFGNGKNKLSPVLSYARYETFTAIRNMADELQAMKEANPNGRS
jgi:hypothetical protein